MLLRAFSGFKEDEFCLAEQRQQGERCMWTVLKINFLKISYLSGTSNFVETSPKHLVLNFINKTGVASVSIPCSGDSKFFLMTV